MSVATEIGTLLAAAAATLPATPKVVIQAGEPDTVNLPTFAYWYMGRGTWEANTFSVTQEQAWWHIRVYVPTGPRFTPSDISLDGWLSDAVDAIRGQFFGHVGLGGAATGQGLELTDAQAGWQGAPNTQLLRVVDMDLRAYVAAVHPIAV